MGGKDSVNIVAIRATEKQAVEWARVCEKLMEGVRARMATCRRKRWPDSTKAMVLAELQQQDDALAQMRAAIVESFGTKKEN